MTDELIAKKDLLTLVGISYGQLYRWKRKGLIPEEWFIRKSTFTGQETFFPRGKVLVRIEKILQLKEDASLDALAELLSVHPLQVALSGAALVSRNIVTAASLELFRRQAGELPTLTFAQILAVFLLETLLRSGEISREEGEMVLGLLLEQAEVCRDGACEVMVLRKLGVSTCCLLAGATAVLVESGTKIVARLPLAQYIEQLKLLLSEGE